MVLTERCAGLVQRRAERDPRVCRRPRAHQYTLSEPANGSIPELLSLSSPLAS
jgi:hypothetical protein